MRGNFSRYFGLALFVLAGFAFMALAQAQPRGAAAPVATQQAPMSPGLSPSASTIPPPTNLPTAIAPDAPGGSVIPATGDLGVCQCIADRTTRNVVCLGSAAECQSTCASTHFAYTPHAIYTCAAPQSTSAATSSAR